MPFNETMMTVQRLSASVEALAVIGAELSLQSSGEQGDKTVVAAFEAVSDALGLSDLDTLEPQQQVLLLGMIRLFFAQAEELLNAPARAPGWTHTDPLVLEVIGRASTIIPMLLAGRPEFENVTSVLDVGVGVGLLAIAATTAWPGATVVGVDVWEPALERARANVAGAGLTDRITIRNQDVTTLDDVDAFDLAWIPTFFIADGQLVATIDRVMQALKPGGWIVLGRFDDVPDPLAQALSDARTIRSGGAIVAVARAVELLEDAGYDAVHELEKHGPIPAGFIVGRKPSS